MSVPQYIIEEAVRLYAELGSTVKVGHRMGISESSVRRYLRVANVARTGHLANQRSQFSRISSGPFSASTGPSTPQPEIERTVPAAPQTVRRFLLTAAQDETAVAEPFFSNLLAYAGHLNAEVMIGGFTYQKGLFEEHAIRSGVFANDVVPYLRAEVVELAPHLVWYGKANILPTATDPLSGWETATRDRSAILPHSKIALKCIPVMPGAIGKQVMTTGVVTLPNYIQRNAGIKGEFHHTIGATVVEVATDGVHFCRQISASLRDGSFYDLNNLVVDGQIVGGQRAEAATFGDVHREKIDDDVALGTWGFDTASETCVGNDSLYDVLQPYHACIHDSFDFTARSHHTRNDPHERVKRIVEGNDDVQDAMRSTSRFLEAIRRPWAKIVHVASNHNMHLHRWLKDETAFRDPVNSAYWCELNAATLRAIQSGDEDFNIHEHALRRESRDKLSEVIFLNEGDSYVVCQGNAPIECGLHGDRGPRGARGSAAAFARTVERMNVAHTHEPAIREAVYYAGTASLLDCGYNSNSQSGWQHAHVVVYPNGKRTVVTMHGKRWRAV